MADGNEGNHYEESDDVVVLSRKSWTAYVRPVLAGLIIVPFFLLLTNSGSYFITLPLAALAAVFFAYRVLVLKSYVLFFDNEGVWVSSGVLPWTKATSGVKWRDLNDAAFFTGFASWLFRSHSLVVRHRFTESGQIYLDHMANGDKVVPAINSRLSDLARAGQLT